MLLKVQLDLLEFLADASEHSLYLDVSTKKTAYSAAAVELDL